MNIVLDELDFIWNFNPNQPRDSHGRWTSIGYTEASKYLDFMPAADIIRFENTYRKLGKAEFVKTRFSGKPKVSDRIDPDAEQIFRSVDRQSFAEDYVGAGDHIGDGRHQTGHYFFNDYETARKMVSASKDRRIIEANIDTTKQITHKQLSELKEKYSERLYNSGIDNSQIIDNDGAFAAMLGITSIKFPDMTLVLDRSSTTVLKDSIYHFYA